MILQLFHSTHMSSKMLEKSLTAAEALRTRCQTEPDLNVYQPLVTSAFEVCVSSTPNSRRRVSSLAAHAVKKTAALIENGVNFPMTPECQQCLESFERALDSIRRYIESIPEQGSSKSLKFRFSAVKFDCESWRLKGTLNAAYKALIERPKKSKLAVHAGASRTECLIEIATVGTRIAGAVCDIPVPGLALGKPAVAMVGLICETAKTVRSNHTAAETIARHAQNVTNSIVNCLDTRTQGQSLTELNRALQQVKDFLDVLQTRRRVASWILAVKDKDRFVELNNALDRALQVFAASENIGATEILRDNTQLLVTLAATVHDDMQRNMTLVHLRETDQTPNGWRSAKPTAFVPFLSIRGGLTFFF
ncbi:hypothetical protein DFH06DRAFT_1257351 [Mycena polygramma]|nr:hypothetical protein DFH06DRAFT_1257351 [Mycena polygramma]